MSSPILTKVSVFRVGSAKLTLKLSDSLPKLLALAVGTALLGSFALKGGVALLNVDKVEDDVEDSREDQ